MSRPYHQFCGVAKALDVVGERWTLLVVRELLLGPRRFGEISEALAGVPPALLTRRLKDLEAAGLVAKEGRRAPYALTEAGRDLEPVVLALGRFGARYLTQPDADDRVNMRWAMLSLKRRYRGDHGRWTLEVRPGEGVFTVELGGWGAMGRGAGGGAPTEGAGGASAGPADAAITRIEGSDNPSLPSAGPADAAITRIEGSGNPSPPSAGSADAAITRIEGSDNPSPPGAGAADAAITRIEGSDNPSLPSAGPGDAAITRIEGSDNPSLPSAGAGEAAITRIEGSDNSSLPSAGPGDAAIARIEGSENPSTRSPVPIDVRDGPAPTPDAVLAGPPMAVGALLMGRRTLDQLLTEGALRFEGDRAAVDALLAGLGLGGSI